jgi:hypothetical protein
MASKNCQNDPVLLYMAKEVGRKVYSMGLEIDYNRDWYSQVERDAFEVGWLEAADESSFQQIPVKFATKSLQLS